MDVKKYNKLDKFQKKMLDVIYYLYGKYKKNNRQEIDFKAKEVSNAIMLVPGALNFCLGELRKKHLIKISLKRSKSMIYKTNFKNKNKKVLENETIRL
jgi:hypothetical protein